MAQQAVRAELGALEYRLERIEALLSEGIVSAEAEAQLRDSLATIERRIRSLKCPPADASLQRRAA